MKSLQTVVLFCLVSVTFALPGWCVNIINVATTDDGIAGPDISLRDAVAAANADADDSVINLAAGSTYELDICGATEDANLSGDLDHDPGGESLTINGNGSIIVQTCPNERVLHGLDETSVIILDDVTITGGGTPAESGGGINSAGRVELYGATVTGNGPGGGIFVGVVDALFSGDLLIAHDSTISANSDFGARIAEGRAEIERSEILGNIGDGLVPSCSTLDLTDSLVANNTERGIGGVDSVLTIVTSTIRDNGTDGVRTTSPGLADLVVEIIRSTIEGNTAAGVACSDCEPLILDNSTVSGNGMGVNAILGTLVELTHVTIVENTLANVVTESGDVTAFATAIASVDAGGSDCMLGGAMFSNGYNFDGDGTCGLGAGPGDQPAAGDPQLEPLGNNLGPTQTHRQLPGSPLIDTVALADCVAPIDQRGVARPKGPGCDTGSVERRDPLFVQLDAFTAEVTPEGVVLRWTTSVEIDNMGFRVLRATADYREKTPVAISAHVVPAAGNELAGADYEVLDPAKLSVGTVRYYLQDIDVWGASTLHGPVTVELEGFRAAHAIETLIDLADVVSGAEGGFAARGMW